jgi:hypothetical protein
MPDRTTTAFTPAQRDTLRDLYAAGCIDRDNAKGCYWPELRHINPVVVGILVEKGWAERRTRKAPAGIRSAAYWLTAAGIAKAREIGPRST